MASKVHNESASSMALGLCVKKFVDDATKKRFSESLEKHSVSAPREVNFDFFSNEPTLDCFDMLFQMETSDGEPIGSSLIRGRGIKLTGSSISEWLECPRSPFKRYSTHGHIDFEGYSAEDANEFFAGRKVANLKASMLRVNHKLLHHIITQVITPKVTVQANYDSCLMTQMCFMKTGDETWVKIAKGMKEFGHLEGTTKIKVKQPARKQDGRKTPASRKSSRIAKGKETKNPVTVSDDEEVDSENTLEEIEVDSIEYSSAQPGDKEANVQTSELQSSHKEGSTPVVQSPHAFHSPKPSFDSSSMMVLVNSVNELKTSVKELLATQKELLDTQKELLCLHRQQVVFKPVSSTFPHPASSQP
ncbi:uncharacterized protein G2W53_026740 [Senna tora]|uniref:Uncharacterized protein n=1 Tax=Senna tora TaxID=362788 RepID=A0A834WFD0_9FABA|nr:uncharacterized protein G2W53_026740 [Senna tora]